METSDEQTRLLQRILDVLQEQSAFAKQQRDEFMAIQQTAIKEQTKGLRMTWFVIAFMVIAVGFIFTMAALEWQEGTTGVVIQPPAVLTEK